MSDPDEKKPEYDWTGDEFAKCHYGWVDECELEEEGEEDDNA